MKKFYILIALLSITYVKLFAQAFNPKNLLIEWEIGANNYQNSGKTLSFLRFKNEGNAPLAKTGWTIYFNFVRKVDAAKIAESGLKIEHHNGDLYSLKPLNNFQGIAPYEHINLKLITTEWLLNYTDAPTGFYLIYDNQPEIGYNLFEPKLIPSTKAEQTKRNDEDNIPIADASIIYKQNEKINALYNNDILKILPTPKSYELLNGQFEIAANTTFELPNKFKNTQQELKNLLQSLPISKQKLGKIVISENKLLSKEAYILEISPSTIKIQAATEKGVFYAIQSLKTLCPPNPKQEILLPCLKIADEPRFSYRGFHLDVARNFSSKETVLKVLDVMALYKLNKFHFHLTDDEGWRLEIPGLAELTTVGAKRGHSLDNKNCLQATYGSGFATSSGYYSKSDFIEILKYATAKQIEVIVELEFAGHARAAIKSMDARYDFFMKKGNKKAAEQYLLRDLNDQSTYESVQQFNDNVVCVALPSTYNFIEKVTSEIVKMYKAAKAPITTIHIGGDEVPSNVWTQSPESQKVIKENNLENEYALNYYFLRKVTTIFNKYHLSTSGWEEIGLRKTMQNNTTTMNPNPDFVADNFTTYVWNNVIGWGAEDLAYRLANAGYNVVFTPVTNTYFDLAYAKNFYEPGYYWGAFIDEEKPFIFAPTDYYKMTKTDNFGNQVNAETFKGKERLTDFGKQHLIGIQACLWSENIKNEEQLTYQMLPKLFSIAERAWSKTPSWEIEKNALKTNLQYEIDWAAFVSKVNTELKRMDNYHGGYAYRIAPAGAIIEDNQLKINCLYHDLDIRFTLDGSEPTLNSNKYLEPINLKGNEAIKVKVFNEKGRGSRTVEVH